MVAALKEFFGSLTQLSQFMDQTNSLAGLTHRRRLSALGAGGLTRERAPIESATCTLYPLRADVPDRDPGGAEHQSDRVALLLRGGTAEHGFVTTPYRVFKDGVVTNQVVHLDATQEEEATIAQANAEVDPNTGRLKGQVRPRRRDDEAVAVPPKRVTADGRLPDADLVGGVR